MLSKQGSWRLKVTVITIFICGVITSVSWVKGAESAVVTIKMRDMPASFEPSNVTISAGDTVDWINVGNSVHHATDDRQMAIKADDVSSPPGGDSFDSGFLQPGEKFSHTFVKAGTYRYVCAAHETDGMVGEIRVNPR